MSRLRRIAASRRSPSPRGKSSRSCALIAAFPETVIENLLDPFVEEAGQLEGQRQRRIIFAGLDRVDGLARHAEPAAKLRLAPVAFRAQHLQPILHQQSEIHCLASYIPSRFAGDVTNQ